MTRVPMMLCKPHRVPECPQCKKGTTMADGEVIGDVRELRQMLADCEQYLKDGETPAQRIERERRDTEAVLTLLLREKQKTEALSKEVELYHWLREHTIATGLSRWMGSAQCLDEAVYRAMGPNVGAKPPVPRSA